MPNPAVSTSAPIARRALRDVIGVTHALGTYHRTEKDYLNEGVDEIRALGSRLAKLYLCARKGHRDENYPFNSKWEKADSLVDLAQNPYYIAAFGKPFTTFVLTTYSVGRDDYQYYRKGFSREDAEFETKQFYDRTKHLLRKYRGSRKTFVLQNWEGDWGLRGHTDPKRDPSAEAIDNMAGWLRPAGGYQPGARGNRRRGERRPRVSGRRVQPRSAEHSLRPAERREPRAPADEGRPRLILGVGGTGGSEPADRGARFHGGSRVVQRDVRPQERLRR